MCINIHPPVFTYTPVTVMETSQGYRDVKAGTAYLYFIQFGQDLLCAYYSLLVEINEAPIYFLGW